MTIEDEYSQLQRLNALIDSDPMNCVARSRRADIFIGYGRMDEAEVDLRAVTQWQPEDPEAHYKLALAQLNRGDLLSALGSFSRAFSLAPMHVAARVSAANVLMELGRIDEAFRCYGDAVDIDPRCVQAISNQGHVLFKKGLFDEAIQKFEHALTLTDSADIRFNKGRAHESLGQESAALVEYYRATRIDPQHGQAQWNKSLLLLKCGAFAAGWECYGFRFANAGFGPAALSTFKPLWDKSKANESTLIWSEQGVGETVLFSGWLASAREISRDIVVSVDRRLCSVYQRSFPELRFIDKDLPIPESIYKTHLPFGAMPKALIDCGKGWLGRRAPVPYLKVDESRVRRIRPDLKQRSEGILCGISWRSNRPVLGADKSFELVDLVSVLHAEGVTFVDLQYGDTSKDIEVALERTGVRVLHYDGVDNYEDFEGHLGLICACDVVITACNTTAHLAGAVGKSGIVLRRSSRSDFWYWHNVDFNLRSIWYPTLKVVDASDLNKLERVDYARLIEDVATL